MYRSAGEIGPWGRCRVLCRIDWLLGFVIRRCDNLDRSFQDCSRNRELYGVWEIYTNNCVRTHYTKWRLDGFRYENQDRAENESTDS